MVVCVAVSVGAYGDELVGVRNICTAGTARRTQRLGPPGRRTTGGRALQPKSTSPIHWPAAGQVEPQKEAPELVD